MAGLHEPNPCVPSGRLMSIIAWSVVGFLFAVGGLCFAGGMGWL